jgi:hypothetical protein
MFVQRTVAELPSRQHQIIEELESELAAAPDDVRGAYGNDISGGNLTWSCLIAESACGHGCRPPLQGYSPSATVRL